MRWAQSASFASTAMTCGIRSVIVSSTFQIAIGVFFSMEGAR
jgi:hypothetical protein